MWLLSKDGSGDALDSGLGVERSWAAAGWSVSDFLIDPFWTDVMAVADWDAVGDDEEAG